ncbi:hypothetical protein OG785_04310 [Streptomyces sp. NBC_00006]|uniref:hypothetical protein n=1 Tax=Streptomyces sp. NBC_00006 TaxID=2975619 RepID=UPI00224FAA48|nr:hypothetical protein [Streptomyces sp. NBC_00006]MCX5529785.1 hypothetical protein [Streptomyces sp. NBC_00006]
MSTAIGMLEQDLLVPNLSQKQDIDQYKGADNNTISMKVEGIQPVHDHALRHDLHALTTSQPLVV